MLIFMEKAPNLSQTEVNNYYLGGVWITAGHSAPDGLAFNVVTSGDLIKKTESFNFSSM